MNDWIFCKNELPIDFSLASYSGLILVEAAEMWIFSNSFFEAAVFDF